MARGQERRRRDQEQGVAGGGDPAAGAVAVLGADEGVDREDHHRPGEGQQHARLAVAQDDVVLQHAALEVGEAVVHHLAFDPDDAFDHLGHDRAPHDVGAEDGEGGARLM